MSDAKRITEVDWHRDGEGDQLLLGVGDDRVSVVVAIPQDIAWSDLEGVLEERDRELRHFLETHEGDRPPGDARQ